MKKSPSEFASLTRLLVVADARHWTDAKTGSQLLQYFADLVDSAKETQDSLCDSCGKVIDSREDVATRQGYIVHLTCREWSRTWFGVRSNGTLRKLRKCIKAHNDQV